MKFRIGKLADLHIMDLTTSQLTGNMGCLNYHSGDCAFHNRLGWCTVYCQSKYKLHPS
jgi:hypothetical protein